MCQCKEIQSIGEFIKETKNDYESWGLGKLPFLPWFRGEPDCGTPLIPKLYRKQDLGDYYENRLVQHFRMRAMAYEKTIHRDETDLWLFLAQHVGLPTRLLDWSEGSLVALYFALQEKKPIVWMLHPFELNRLSTPGDTSGKPYNIYGLTWYSREGAINIASQNIKAAWQNDEGAIDLPVAIPPTYVHSRIPAQKSCFTVHGKRKESFCKLLFDKGILKKYVIDSNKSQEMLDELRILGMSRTTLFPDLDGLAKDLTKLFRPDLARNT